MDIGSLFAEPETAYALPLLPGDVLYIPEFRNQIAVLGAITEPGIVSYTAGETLEHFVALAGGYTQRADVSEVVVLKARLGNEVHRDDNPILEPGDRIIVPFKEERTFLEQVQATQGILSTLSGLVLTIVGLERLWDAVAN